MDTNTPDSTTPAPAPQAPDFDATAANIVGASCRAASSAYQRAPEVVALIKAAKRYTDKCDESSIDRLCDAAWGLEEAGGVEAIHAPADKPSPELAALIDAARAYAAHHALPGTTKTTTATEHAIDAVLAACRALAESEATNG